MIEPSVFVGSVVSWTQRFSLVADSQERAVLEEDGSLSFAELSRLAAGAALWLDEHEVPVGSSVAALVSMTTNSCALVLACAATGRVFAPIGTRLTAPEARACLDSLGATVLVVAPEAMELATAAAESLGRITVLVLPDFEPADRQLDWDVADDTVLAIVHTSGTMGRPKAIPFTNERLGARTAVNALLLGLRPGTAFAAGSPLHHIAGIGMLYVAFGAGAALCPVARFSIDSWDAVMALGVTHAQLVPSMVEHLLVEGRLVPGRLETLHYGASPIHPETLRTMLDALPGVRVVQLYGQTEGSPITALSAEDHRGAVEGRPSLLRTAGRAVPGLELRIERADDTGIGEVVARGPHLMLPDADGWMRTGDLGRLDAEGYLTLHGRKGDMIIRGGENVYPEEVERVLRSHPSVLDAVVVGDPDRRLGQVLHAHVIVVDTAGVAWPTEEELRTFVRSELAGFKVPQRWTFVGEFPRNAAGKVLRRLMVAGDPLETGA